ncbi:MAG: SBBP repeat-containing protein [Actinomycetota bacterium]
MQWKHQHPLRRWTKTGRFSLLASAAAVLTLTPFALSGPVSAASSDADAQSPSLLFRDNIGGYGTDWAWHNTVGPDGSSYLTGYTESPDFPTTSGVIQPDYGGSTDAFVAKIDPTGSTVEWATYLGGAYEDAGDAVAVGPGGTVFVTGLTYSHDFPTTSGTVRQTWPGRDRRAFVAELDSSGSHLLYSTFLPGTTYGHGIAVDSAGDAFVVGTTGWTDLPVTPGVADSVLNDGKNTAAEDAYVMKLDPTGSKLLYATYLGGFSDEAGMTVDLDSKGDAFVAGNTTSPDFPGVPDQPPSDHYIVTQGFVAKLSPDASSIDYAILVGGSGEEDLRTLTVTPRGTAYVGGSTWSSDFPVTPRAYSGTLHGNSDAFVVEVNSVGTGLVAATLFGGAGAESGYAGVDSAGNLYLAGSTNSTNLPTSTNAAQPGYGGGGLDAYLAVFDPTASSIEYASYLGGEGEEFVVNDAIDGAGVSYLAGWTTPASHAASPTDLAGRSAAVASDVLTAAVAVRCTVAGTAASETLAGTVHRDVICGRGGADIIKAGGGSDVLLGGAGNDHIYGDRGADIILGRDGSDTVVGGPGTDLLSGGPGNDSLAGGLHADHLFGGGGDDALGGGAGRDTCRGGAGHDRLTSCEL